MKLILGLLTFFATSLALAAPAFFTYEGVLTDSSGNAITTPTSFNIRFEVLDPAGTCVLFQQDSAVTTDADGAIAVVIGPSGLYAANAAAQTGSDNKFNYIFRALNMGTCVGGAPSYDATGLSNASRKLKVSLCDAGFTSCTAFNSAIDIASAPFATQASYATQAVDLRPDADINMGGFKLTGLDVPSAATDAATKGYVDTADTAINSSITALTTTVAGKVASVTAGSGIAVTGSTSPSVSLISCANGEILKHNGTSWACAADNSGAAPGDASYAAKGIVQFDADVATSGISVTSGVAKVNYGTGADQIVKLDSSGKLPAVDGSALTNVVAVSAATATTAVSATTASKLAPGGAPTTGYVYTSNGASDPSWQAMPSDSSKLAVSGGTATNLSVVNNLKLTDNAGVELSESNVNGTNKIIHKAAGNLSADWTYTWPAATTGDAGKVLSTDASGNLSWITGGGGSDNLGNHTATTNINLAGNWLSGDGGSEGINIDASGKVGIGTNTPGSNLHVYVTANDASTTIQSSGDFQSSINLTNFSGVSRTWRIMNDSSGGIGAGKLNIYDGTSRLVIDTTGNVGIGTTSPGRKLHVLGGQIESDVNTDTDTAISSIISTRTRSTATAPGAGMGTGFRFDLEGFTNNSIATGAGEIKAIWENAQSNDTTSRNAMMTFSTMSSSTPTERVRITSTGNVGIGTTNPGSALDVKGSIRLSGSTSGYVGFQPAAAAGSTTYTLPTGDGSSGQVLTTNGSGTLSWGSVISAEVDPTVSSSTANYIPTWDGTNLVDGTIFDDGSGFVGIGTSSPISDLDVTPAGTWGMLNVGTNAPTFGPSIVLNADNGGSAKNYSLNSTRSGDVGFGTEGSFVIYDESSAVSRLNIISNGNVGIGTTTPSTKLDVAGAIRVGTDALLPCDATTRGAIRYNGTDVETCSNTGWSGGGGGGSANGNNGNLQFSNGSGGFVSNDNLVWDNTNSRLGIGTNAPSSKFHVEGSASEYFQFVSAANTGTSLNVYTQGAVPLGLYTNTAGVDLKPPAAGYRTFVFPDNNSTIGYFLKATTATNNTTWSAINSSDISDASSANSVSMVVKRDSNGDFSSNIITANGLKLKNISNGPTMSAGAGSADYNLTWPLAAASSNGQALVSTTGGILSWQSVLTTESDPKVGTSTVNKIPKWNGSALVDSVSISEDGAGKVGIGTTGPLEFEANNIHFNTATGYINNKTTNGIITFRTGTSPANMAKIGPGSTGIESTSLTGALYGARFVANSSAAGGKKYSIISSLGSDSVGGTGNFAIVDDTAAVARMIIDTNGKVGVGITPTATSPKLQVDGAIVGKAITTGGIGAVATVPVNFDAANTFILSGMSHAGPTFSINNAVEGGSYTIVVTDTASKTYLFGGMCMTSRFKPANGATTAGSHTIYNIQYLGGTCYISWSTGWL